MALDKRPDHLHNCLAHLHNGFAHFFESFANSFEEAATPAAPACPDLHKLFRWCLHVFKKELSTGPLGFEGVVLVAPQQHGMLSVAYLVELARSDLLLLAQK